MTVTVKEFEQRVWEVEGVRLVVRAKPTEDVEHYGFERAFDDNRTLQVLLKSRIRPCIKNYKVQAVKGDGTLAHTATKLRNLRASYGG